MIKLSSTQTFVNLFLFVKDNFNKLTTATKITLNVKKACHCNKVFLRKTKLVLALNHFVKKSSYYHTYFAFRRSGIHPPFVVS